MNRRITISNLQKGRGAQRGVTLVVVLGFLVLITILIVAFFTLVTNESAATKVYASGASTKFLADSTTNVVMGQITQATQGQNSGGHRQTWASQPGMIRTYSEQGLAGDCFKLYSSPKMVVAAGDVQSEMASDVPATWNKQPALYTDLNAPVADSSGTLNFPILDGNVTLFSVNGANVLTYKSMIGTTPDIEGFSIPPDSVPTYAQGKPISATNNPVAMPVQWIYMLKDGSMIAADPGGDGITATFNTGAIQPSKTNPIVGRIAFWTDDETCKLNINTASEGTDYAFPRVNSPTEMDSPGTSPTRKSFGYAVCPPATGEYNRYPGHPATTCLSVAMDAWMNTTLGKTAPTAYSSAAADNAYITGLTNYLTMLPRYQLGGSYAGLVRGASPSFTVVQRDNDRLFASFDELIFDPQRNPSAKLNRATVEKLKFFLTASNRSPEVTPFNTPKISMWSQWFTPADRNKYQDVTRKLLAFCSSFGTAGSGSSSSGKNEYFFQRYAALPSGGSPDSCHSSVLDWTGVSRNRQLANYIYQMGSNPIPGYGQAFTGKYESATFSSLIVETLDCLRSNIGKLDMVGPSDEVLIVPMVVSSGLPGATADNPLKGFGDYPQLTQLCLGEGLAGVPASPVPFLVFQFFFPTKGVQGSDQFLSNALLQKTENLGVTPLPGQQALSGTIALPHLWEWENDRTPTMTGVGYTFNGYTFDNTQTTTTIGSDSPVVLTFRDDDGNPFQNITLKFPAVTLPAPNPKHTMPGGWYLASGGPVGAMASLANDACVIRSVESSFDNPFQGDWRLMGAYVNLNQIQKQDVFKPTKSYQSSYLQAHTLRLNDRYDSKVTEPTFPNNVLKPPTTSMMGSLTSLLKNTDYLDTEAPCAPLGMTAALNSQGRPGDWDTGPGLEADGPYLSNTENGPTTDSSQFFDSNSNGLGTSNVAFSPNRIVASPIRFGSLPTGYSLTNPKPWQTLLFCPNPAARSTSAGGVPSGNDHPGFANPPDHIYLEFFTMPTVEPYPISEPLSSAGKVNLNYQIAPFTNIERSTALRGVLKSTLLPAISGMDVKGNGAHPQTGSSNSYKFGSWTGAGLACETRYQISRDPTIAGIEEHYFNQGKLFMYPSQICDVFLVPKRLTGATYNTKAALPPTTYDSMMNWWGPADLSTMSLTGDNLREEPYDRIYARLTTKSNTYTVHYRVQVLQKRPTSDPTIWVEGQDLINAEHRGSSMIERYVDPNDPQLDSAWDQDTMSLSGKCDLSGLYKFRVISTKKFAP